MGDSTGAEPIAWKVHALEQATTWTLNVSHCLMTAAASGRSQGGTQKSRTGQSSGGVALVHNTLAQAFGTDT